RTFIVPVSALGMRAKRTRPQSIYLEKRFHRPQPRCPLWVKSGHCAVSDRCPLYPRKRTLDRADPIGLSCPLLLLSPEGPAYLGRTMEWFKQTTSIAGVQVSNWMIVLGAIIIVLLIFQNFH